MNFSFILLRNNSDTKIVLSNDIRLGYLTKYNITGGYLTKPEDYSLITLYMLIKLRASIETKLPTRVTLYRDEY